MFAKVDDEDFEYLNQWKWHVLKGCSKYYASRADNEKTRKGKQVRILMHREVCDGLEKEKFVDHIDGNGLNNQKENLRPCSHLQNKRNCEKKKQDNLTSKYKGVTKRTFINKDGSITNTYRCCFNFNQSTRFTKTFKKELDAAKMYDELAKKHHGEFANLNFK